MKALAGMFVVFVVWTSVAAAISHPVGDTKPTVRAHFTRRSYAPREFAAFEVSADASPLQLRIFHVGPELGMSRAADVLTGVAVTPQATIAPHSRRVRVRIGDWASGLYYAQLTDHRRTGYATFVVRSRVLGRVRAAVVLPTNTWQAYNFRDVNGDGIGDTWYADPRITTVDLERPFLDRGVPAGFKQYSLGFIEWLAHSGNRADFLTDDDLEEIPGNRLARLYDLIVFPGHTEYVTTSEFDAVQRYRDLGGNLMFLSANNFFYRVEREGDQIIRRGRWRDLGRPEARLIGAQYVDWNHDRYSNRPYIVSGAAHARWFFRGTGLRDGDSFGHYGIEIDAPTSHSPPGVRVLARIPNAFGPGKTAEMTYYTTANGGKVFDAGVINFGGTVRWPTIRTMMNNLWQKLSVP